MNENNEINNTPNKMVVGDEHEVNNMSSVPHQQSSQAEPKGGKDSLGNLQKVLTGIMVTAGLLLGALLVALQLSSPTGNIGDEGIIAVPLVLALVPITPIAFLVSLLYLLIRRPSGRSLAITILGILFPLAMLGSMFGYGSIQHRQGLISTEEAISLVQQCEVKQLGSSTNHNRTEIKLVEPNGKKHYIDSKDSGLVKQELEKAKANC